MGGPESRGTRCATADSRRSAWPGKAIPAWFQDGKNAVRNRQGKECSRKYQGRFQNQRQGAACAGNDPSPNPQAVPGTTGLASKGRGSPGNPVLQAGHFSRMEDTAWHCRCIRIRRPSMPPRYHVQIIRIEGLPFDNLPALTKVSFPADSRLPAPAKAP